MSQELVISLTYHLANKMNYLLLKKSNTYIPNMDHQGESMEVLFYFLIEGIIFYALYDDFVKTVKEGNCTYFGYNAIAFDVIDENTLKLYDQFLPDELSYSL